MKGASGRCGNGRGIQLASIVIRLLDWRGGSSEPEGVTYRGSKSAKSARILSPLPSSVHDSTDPSSGWSNTKLYFFRSLMTKISQSDVWFIETKRGAPAVTLTMQ